VSSLETFHAEEEIAEDKNKMDWPEEILKRFST
jgi:hypothetical protein